METMNLNQIKKEYNALVTEVNESLSALFRAYKLENDHVICEENELQLYGTYKTVWEKLIYLDQFNNFRTPDLLPRSKPLFIQDKTNYGFLKEKQELFKPYYAILLKLNDKINETVHESTIRDSRLDLKEDGETSSIRNSYIAIHQSDLENCWIKGGEKNNKTLFFEDCTLKKIKILENPGPINFTNCRVSDSDFSKINTCDVVYENSVFMDCQVATSEVLSSTAVIKNCTFITSESNKNNIDLSIYKTKIVNSDFINHKIEILELNGDFEDNFITNSEIVIIEGHKNPSDFGYHNFFKNCKFEVGNHLKLEKLDFSNNYYINCDLSGIGLNVKKIVLPVGANTGHVDDFYFTPEQLEKIEITFA